MGKTQNRVDEEGKMFRRNCGSEAVFTDAWNPGADVDMVSGQELLPGEIVAVTVRVGCYIVRSALRVYTIQDPDWYLAEVRETASEEDIEMVRKDPIWDNGKGRSIYAEGRIFESWGSTYDHADAAPSWREKLRVTHEISARHDSSPNSPFTYICRAADPMNGKWFEYIGDIYAVKENEDTPDERASLLVYFVFTSDFYGVDTWYRFAPDGELTTFVSELKHLDRR